MKLAGWILVVFVVLNFIFVIIGAANGAPGEWIGVRIAFIIGAGIIGGLIIYKAKHKSDDEDPDNWSNT